MDVFEKSSSELEEKPAHRHSVDLQFEYKKNYGRQTNLAQVRNISLTGALIKADTDLKPNEKINVFLTVQGRRRKVAAKVVWNKNGGVGVEFQPFNNRDLQIVDDIIYYATEKSSSNKSLMNSILSKVAA